MCLSSQDVYTPHTGRKVESGISSTLSDANGLESAGVIVFQSDLDMCDPLKINFPCGQVILSNQKVTSHESGDVLLEHPCYHALRIRRLAIDL